MGNKKYSKKSKAREQRIYKEIIIDCYSEEEQMMGWRTYLEDTLKFPFTAKCVKKRSISPLKIGETVEAIGLSELEDCRSEMFVMIKWCNHQFGVPLSQLETVKSDAKTKQAVEDWKYWLQY